MMFKLASETEDENAQAGKAERERGRSPVSFRKQYLCNVKHKNTQAEFLKISHVLWLLLLLNTRLDTG